MLAAQGLSCILKSRNQSSILKGIKVAPSAPSISHLVFADDSLLFFKVDRESVLEINDVLLLYCQASGQHINLDKSSIFFTKGQEVLIKFVAQAISTYSMSCFRLPRGLCHHITSLLGNFWWGSKEGKRKTCWFA